MTPEAILATGLQALHVEASVSQRRQLMQYLVLLQRWNRAFNLTAVRDPALMVTRHLLDSLSVLPWLAADTSLDAGTGAGLPGIPLAILRPQQVFVLLDSNGKKVRFVRQVVTELGLTNVEVVQSRAEQYRNASPQVIARAFAALPAMLALTEHLVLPGGRLLAMKGMLTDPEMAGIPPGWTPEIVPLEVPGLAEARQLVILERAAGQQIRAPAQGETA